MIPQFSNQPNAYAELARQVMFWAIGMGFVHLTEAQQGLTLSLVSAVLAVLVWRNVVPTQTVEDAGHSVSQLKADAKEFRSGTGDGGIGNKPGGQ